MKSSPNCLQWQWHVYQPQERQCSIKTSSAVTPPILWEQHAQRAGGAAHRSVGSTPHCCPAASCAAVVKPSAAQASAALTLQPFVSTSRMLRSTSSDACAQSAAACDLLRVKGKGTSMQECCLVGCTTICRHSMHYPQRVWPCGPCDSRGAVAINWEYDQGASERMTVSAVERSGSKTGKAATAPPRA